MARGQQTPDYRGRSARKPDHQHRAVSQAYLLAVLVAGLTIAGCTSTTPTASSASPTPSSVPATAPEPVLPAATVPQLPIQTYMFTQVEVYRAEQARFVLSKKCMDSFGVPFTIPSLPAITPAKDIDQQDRRYGVTNMAEARSLGYHPPAELITQNTQAPMITTMSPTQKLVYFGLPSDQHTYQGHPIPPGGCTAAAARQLAPVGELSHSELTAQISHDSFKTSLSSPPVTAALGQWSVCMHNAGYDYPTPLASGGDRRWSTPQPTPAEITAAVTDINCQHETSLIQIWSAAERAIQQQQIAANTAALNVIQQEKQQQLTVINSVLSG